MAFWKLPAFSPINKYQFIFNIGSEQFTVHAKSVTLPTYSTEGFTSKMLNHEVKYPGVGHWDDLVVSFVLTEDMKQSTFMALTGYNNFSVNSSTVPKFQISPNITIIGKEGNTVNTWSFAGAYVKQVNFGDFSYDEDSLATIEMTISVDYASVNGSGTNPNAVADNMTTRLGETIVDEAGEPVTESTFDNDGLDPNLFPPESQEDDLFAELFPGESQY